LKAIRERYPVTLHGVGLSIGSTDPLDRGYLTKLKQLADTIQPAFISDHLSWSSVNHQCLHDLLPLPFTQEAIDHVSNRLLHVQDFLGQPLLMENASSYLACKDNVMPEWDFINAIVEKSGCHVLLDINNIYVSAFNQGFKPEEYLQQINPTCVKQYHLAGYSEEDNYLFDMHNQAIHQPVWDLYERALKVIGVHPTLIERDNNIPPFDVLYAEAKQTDQLIKSSKNSCLV
jgi:uncharacterized protein